MNYKQITSEERYTISSLKKQGYSNSKIAQILGRHRSTIGREICRNSCWMTDGAYRPSKAQTRTQTRRRRARQHLHFTNDDFSEVRRLLRKKFSPEQITGRLRQQKISPSFSHETIYRYIWRDKAEGGSLWKHLRCSRKQRRKRYRAYDSRGRMSDKRPITERPASIETRRYFGHWEIDTVLGKGAPDCIVTLVERKTGYTIIGKLRDRTTKSLNKRTIKLIQKDPVAFKTITSDNGTEFHQYKEIERACSVKFYFATPHHSWERGTNENTNGLIRQYIPKGTSMASLTQQQCDAIAHKLNTRPRKRLGYQTPEEVYYNA